MTKQEEIGIQNLVANVANNEINTKQNKTIGETQEFIQNRDNFIFWLYSKLKSKEGIFLGKIGLLSRNDSYVFCYAIKNPEHFAKVLIETLEGE